MRSCSRSVAGVCATERLGLAGDDSVGPGVWKREMSPQADRLTAAHSSMGAAKRLRPRRPICCVVPVVNRVILFLTRSLVIASRSRLVRKQFQLPQPEQFDSGTGPRLDVAANANPSILEGLRRHAGRL